MKSLHSLGNFDFEKPNVFLSEIISFILNEDFSLRTNNSYNEKLIGTKVYYNYIANISSFDIFVYIGSNGIAVDVDYDCGGNSNTNFFEFSNRDFDMDTVF